MDLGVCVRVYWASNWLAVRGWSMSELSATGGLPWFLSRNRARRTAAAKGGVTFQLIHGRIHP